MLAPTLRRYRSCGALDQFQQRLLHTLARNITGNRRVIRLARDLVDLIDIDDAPLGLLHIVIALQQQLLNDVLDIFTHVARLCQSRGIGNGERHVKQACHGFGQQGLTATGRTDQQNIGLAQLDFVVLATGTETFVVIVDCYRKHRFGTILANHIVIESAANFAGNGQTLLVTLGLGIENFLTNDVVTQIDTLVADIHGRAGYQPAHFVLVFATERAVKQFAAFVLAFAVGHSRTSVTSVAGSATINLYEANLISRYQDVGRLSSTASMRPYSTACELLMKLSRSVSRAMVSIS